LQAAQQQHAEAQVSAEQGDGSWARLHRLHAGQQQNAEAHKATLEQGT
jgi:hypothetical protein